MPYKHAIKHRNRRFVGHNPRIRITEEWLKFPSYSALSNIAKKLLKISPNKELTIGMKSQSLNMTTASMMEKISRRHPSSLHTRLYQSSIPCDLFRWNKDP